MVATRQPTKQDLLEQAYQLMEQAHRLLAKSAALLAWPAATVTIGTGFEGSESIVVVPKNWSVEDCRRMILLSAEMVALADRLAGSGLGGPLPPVEG